MKYILLRENHRINLEDNLIVFSETDQLQIFSLLPPLFSKSIEFTTLFVFFFDFILFLFFQDFSSFDFSSSRSSMITNSNRIWNFFFFSRSSDPLEFLVFFFFLVFFHGVSKTVKSTRHRLRSEGSDASRHSALSPVDFTVQSVWGARETYKNTSCFIRWGTLIGDFYRWGIQKISLLWGEIAAI